MTHVFHQHRIKQKWWVFSWVDVEKVKHQQQIEYVIQIFQMV